jgi:hypothetical protein
VKFPATRGEIEEFGYTFVFARPCKRCGADLMFYRAPVTGGMVPFEYVTVGREWRIDSHFKTCPYRDEFKKPASPAPPSRQGDLFGGKKS